jgi:hypothetical protein
MRRKRMPGVRVVKRAMRQLREEESLADKDIRAARIERLFFALWAVAMTGYLGWFVMYAWWERIGPF